MGTKLSDVLTGMYMLKTEDARHVHFHSAGFNVEIEIAAQLAQDDSVPRFRSATVKGSASRNSRHGGTVFS